MVFADSSGFIAAFDPNDQRHQEGARAWQEIARSGERLLTTGLVLAETVTHVRRRAGWQAANRIGEAVLASRAIEIVFPDRELTLAAWREFKRSGAPNLSLCDALSFVVMRDRTVGRALTFDADFRDAGFEILPDIATVPPTKRRR